MGIKGCRAILMFESRATQSFIQLMVVLVDGRKRKTDKKENDNMLVPYLVFFNF